MIRHACYQDIDAIVRFCKRSHDQSPSYQGKAFDADHTRLNVEARVFHPYSLVLVNDDITGVLIASAATATFNTGLVVGNEFFDSGPDAAWFVRRYLKWAKSLGPISDISFSISFGGEAGEKMARLLNRLGMHQIGTLHRI